MGTLLFVFGFLCLVALNKIMVSKNFRIPKNCDYYSDSLPLRLNSKVKFESVTVETQGTLIKCKIIQSFDYFPCIL